MPYTIHLRKHIDFHSEGASYERYILTKETSLPFRPTVGLEVLHPDSFGYTCQRVVWRSAQDDYVVWDEKDEINFDTLMRDYQSIANGVSIYLSQGWQSADKIPNPEEED